jgi:DNA mismatch repair protein MutL
MTIKALTPEVASQIAAGEVVERPASVVKELIENSLDAGSDEIEVTVEGAGQKLIQVIDNGSGIPAQELALAVDRHTTSKLSQAGDLFRITTFGFRGEALASIGSVSRMTIISRAPDGELGARILVDGGRIGELEMVGAPPGTAARVENLFYNVPARKKFLKHPTTEKRHIDEQVTRYALAHPEVRFQLLQDDRTVLKTSGNGNRCEVLGSLYGADVARQMLEVLAKDDLVRVTGYISPPSLTRSNRREITFFVNGRPIQDYSLTSAVMKAYHTYLMVGRFPIAVLFLDIPAEKVDVNVHPTKAEVRFHDSSQVFTGIQRAVRRALLAHSPVPGLKDPPGWIPTMWSDRGSWGPGGQAAGVKADWPDDQWGQPQTNTDSFLVGSLEEVPSTELRTPLLRPVGQVANAYLVAEGPDGLYLIDQHAAHERILFERFMTQREEEVARQTLLQPQAVELSPSEARLLEPELPTLEKLGFQVEPFGRGTFLVRAIPAMLSNMDPGSALRVLVEDFEEDETPLESQKEAKIIARVCKRAAIKAGQPLSPDEQQALITDLESSISPRTCPHGRPTMIHLSVDLLERQFGRKGAR